MKIGKTLKKKQVRFRYRKARLYVPVWEQAAKLRSGECVPVECDTLMEKSYLQQAALGHRTQRFHTRSKGLTIYIFKCDDPQCDANHRARLNSN